MKDSELINEFTRVKHHEDRIAIQVAWITWPHPHESKLHWHTVKNLNTGEDPALINITRKSIINNEKYFRICSECNVRNPYGWMWEGKICQSCAERNHEVVF